MRYEGTKPSKVDKEKNVYVFAFGVEEMNLFHGIVIDALSRCPKITETQIVRARLINMRKRLTEVIKNKK